MTPLAAELAAMTDPELEAFVGCCTTQDQLDALAAALAEVEAERGFTAWRREARPEQLAPAEFYIWLILAGRGWGKTRTGAEWLAEQMRRHPRSDWGIFGPTYPATRDVCVEGRESGLLRCLGDLVRTYNRSLGEIVLHNEARAKLVSADEPDRARGWNFWGAWCDELAAWRYPQTWHEGLVPAVRAGVAPRIVVTTTPKPVPLVKDLVARAGQDVVLTRGRTLDNAANLAPGVVAALLRQYDGTRIGRQELDGELLEDVEGSLWRREWIDAARVPSVRMMGRVIVGVDPSGSAKGAECGIVVVGSEFTKASASAYVVGDWSGRFSPAEWGARVREAYHHHQADLIVAERNFGGDMVREIIRAQEPGLPYRDVTASRGKVVRAEPIANLYERGMVHHVGSLPELEDQLCSWVPGNSSPDRLDALVWAITALGTGSGGAVTNPRTHKGPRGITDDLLTAAL